MSHNIRIQKKEVVRGCGGEAKDGGAVHQQRQPRRSLGRTFIPCSCGQGKVAPVLVEVSGPMGWASTHMQPAQRLLYVHDVSTWEQ